MKQNRMKKNACLILNLVAYPLKGLYLMLF